MLPARVAARLRIPPALRCPRAVWGAWGGLPRPPFTPSPALGARLLALGLFWSPCEKEQGRRACESGTLRPALGRGEAIRSHWQPASACYCLWRPVRLLQGRGRPSLMPCRGRRKTLIWLPRGPLGSGVSTPCSHPKEYPLIRVLGKPGLSIWWKSLVDLLGAKVRKDPGGLQGSSPRGAGLGPDSAPCSPESEGLAER